MNEVVIFGGAGDLAIRKLYPALFHLFITGCFPEKGNIYVCARRELSEEEGRNLVREAVNPLLESDALFRNKCSEALSSFIERIHYVRVDINNPDDFNALKAQLNNDDSGRVFYCATASSLYEAICRGLKSGKLISEQSRIVLEKPIGSDSQTSAAINNMVAEYFSEHQVYRIDHYLGKEGVRNLPDFRRLHPETEKHWNNKSILQVTISVSEELGVEERAGFYDDAGAFRDMVQNHLLQVFSLIAMDMPDSSDPDDMRLNKYHAVRSLKHLQVGIDGGDVVLGQYDDGFIQGKSVTGYRNEPGIPSDSRTETFVAIRAEVTSERWLNVPFILKTGKRLENRKSEVRILFREGALAGEKAGFSIADDCQAELIFDLNDPDATRLLCGEDEIIIHSHSDTEYKNEAGKSRRIPDAYEHLLEDVINGDQGRFVRDDEMAAAWEWAEPLIRMIDKKEITPVLYEAGSAGPDISGLMLD